MGHLLRKWLCGRLRQWGEGERNTQQREKQRLRAGERGPAGHHAEPSQLPTVTQASSRGSWVSLK